MNLERAEDKELPMIEALERDVAEMAYQLYEAGYISKARMLKIFRASESMAAIEKRLSALEARRRQAPSAV